VTILRTWCAHEARSRWRSLLVLCLLFTLAVGAVLAATAGALRGATAADRLWDRTVPTHALVLLNEPGFDWDAVRGLPGVEAVTTFAVASFTIDEVPSAAGDSVYAFPPADPEVWHSIERPVVLAGRLPDPARDDEVAVTAGFTRRVGIGVGDRVTVRLYSGEQADLAMQAEELGAPEGPAIPSRVVGVIRSPWFADRVDATFGVVVPSPGLFEQHRSSFLGSKGGGYVNGLVRLDDGRAALDDFRADLTALTHGKEADVSDAGEVLDHARDVTAFEASFLLALALAAGVGGVVILGQALVRYCGSTRRELDVLRSLGVGTRDARLLGATGPTVAALAGTVGGVALATVASRWFPVGSAALLEPDPGVDLDLRVMAGAMAVPLVVLMTGMLSSGPTRSESPPAGRPGTEAPLIGAAPLPISLGIRFALRAGRGARSIPSRPALAGMVVGVAGVTGALTFAGGVTEATDGYGAFGQTYEMATFFGLNGEDFTPAAELLSTVTADPDGQGVIDARTDIADVEDQALSLYSYDVQGRHDTVVIAGRMPESAGEIALAPPSAEALDVGVGDEVDMSGTAGAMTARVTGLALLPAGPHNGYAVGGWLSTEGYKAMFDGFKFHFGLADLVDGASPQVVADRLQEKGITMQVGPLIPPPERSELRQVRGLPVLLAGFLALLAVGAVGHALASTVRRRGHDLAILRALGMSTGAVRAVILTQGAVIGTVGFVVGVPVGIAIGRRLWTLVAEQTPVAAVQAGPWLLVGLASSGALLAALLLALGPSGRATKLLLGPALRSEMVRLR